MKFWRRQKWEREVKWDEKDENRIFTSLEMLPEDRQDFSSPMVLVGSDVVSLYPNLDVSKVSKVMYEAVLESDMSWDNVDLLECTRYVALNWSKERCLKSKIRRILPRRRGRTGTRPGLKGAGPRGKERGDTEQWVFPSV